MALLPKQNDQGLKDACFQETIHFVLLLHPVDSLQLISHSVANTTGPHP
jgi:hypothetical protein